MILGQLIVGIANTTVTYYSPWFTRGGNLAKFSCQVVAYDDLAGSDKFQIGVETKNSEDSDKTVTTPQGGAAVAMTLSPLTIKTWQVGANLSSANVGFLELVRFKYQIVSVNANKEPWVHIRMLNPVWLSN